MDGVILNNMSRAKDFTDKDYFMNIVRYLDGYCNLKKLSEINKSSNVLVKRATNLKQIVYDKRNKYNCEMLKNYIIKKYILDLNKSLKIKFLQAFLSSDDNIVNDKNDKSDQLTLFSQKIDHFKIQIIDYFIRLFANLLILLAIFGFLLFTEKLITLYLVSLSLTFFILYHFTFSKFIKRLSEGYYLNFTSNIKNFLNIINNAIQIKLYQRNDIFIENSEKWISRSNKDSLKFYIIQIFPRQLLEFLVILFILIIYFFIQGQVENKTVIIFYSTIFLVAFYRMMLPFLFLIAFFNNLRFFSIQ